MFPWVLIIITLILALIAFGLYKLKLRTQAKDAASKTGPDTDKDKDKAKAEAKTLSWKSLQNAQIGWFIAGVIIILLCLWIWDTYFVKMKAELRTSQMAIESRQSSVQPGKHLSGKLTLSETPSSAISVNSANGEKIEFGPTKWAVYKALVNDGASVLTFTPRGIHTTDGRQVKDLRNVRFVLAQPTAEPVELVYFKYTGELPANWWEIATNETR
jgi:hypothetical protein